MYAKAAALFSLLSSARYTIHSFIWRKCEIFVSFASPSRISLIVAKRNESAKCSPFCSKYIRVHSLYIKTTFQAFESYTSLGPPTFHNHIHVNLVAIHEESPYFLWHFAKVFWRYSGSATEIGLWLGYCCIRYPMTFEYLKCTTKSEYFASLCLICNNSNVSLSLKSKIK